MFRTSTPVIADAFQNRDKELAKLLDAVNRLRAGAPAWVAILGPRKVGKTSLLLELARRARHPDLVVAVLDVLESMPVSLEFFRLYALRVLDKTLGPETGESLEILVRQPAEFRRALLRSARFKQLSPTLQAEVQELVEREADGNFVKACLDLPEQLAQALNLYVVVAIDEFEELALLATQRHAFDPFPLLRSVWQHHKSVSYMVSGSARSFLTEMVAAEHSPFFQHFSLLEVGPFSEQDAVQLLVSRSVAVNPIPASLAARGVEVIGGHPFYLQLLGESLLSEPPPLNEQSLKTALQDTVFSRTGRLALYFENEFHRRVGHSTGLAAVLEALAQGPKRLAEIAREIGAASGTTAHYLERLQDAVGYREDSKYELADPTFALWLRWRRPGGTVVPMAVVGDEAERRIAEHLSRMGFELVYPSRGSRGAFDLLATRGTHQLAVQVKRSALPLRFDGPEWDRMVADAARFHWRWVLAAVTPESNVLILDPAKSQHGREVRLDAAAAIENLLLWLDQEEH